MIQTHNLKTSPGYFEQVWQGLKTFEIRRDDRGFQRGDVVVLEEFDFHAACDCPNKARHNFTTCEKYTGRTITADIGCVIGQMPGRGGERGFSGMGWVVFSLVKPRLDTVEFEVDAPAAEEVSA